MDWRIASFPIVSALLGLALGYALARWVSARSGWVLVVVCLGAALVLGIMAQGRSGMDGLGHIVVAVLMAAPAGLGAAIGTMIAVALASRR
jgi:hypothetical protein